MRQPESAVPARSGTAYAAVGERLRRDIAAGTYRPGVALPTEIELAERHAVGRQTVRRAFQDLVAEGLVYRVPGRGTFVAGLTGTYIRSSGSIDDLLALSIDTDLEVVSPPRSVVDIEAAGRLHLDADIVVTMGFRRLHAGRVYCTTVAYFPPEVGRQVMAAPELGVVGVHRHTTVLATVRRVTGRPIAGADQMITAVAATAQVAADLGCAVGAPVLRIDRLYLDQHGDFLELAVNHFSPQRYTYRFQMRAHEG
jgi:DNA-binding GntR family transcriptional regulator